MITFAAVGDVGPESPDVDALFAGVAPAIRAADLAFCQLEMNLTERGQRVPQVRHTSRTHPDAAHAIRRAGFDVVSWASNHALDWGYEGFFDTIRALEAADLAVIGVGTDLAQARRIRVIEIRGVRVAVLAYCSILPADYWATERRAGVAPMRALTHCEPIEPDQPGTPVRIRTFAHPDDLRGLLDDVAQARQLADAVVVSFHWGIHFVPAQLADYQRAVAHAAIDAGADLILGHHAHILKGIEVYRGKAIFYSLGNFVIELPMDEEHASRPTFKDLQRLNPNWEVDFSSNFNFPYDSRKTVIVGCDIDRDGVSNVTLRPAWIDKRAIPELLAPDDPRFAEVVDYLAAVSADENLPVRFVVDGDRVRVEAP